MAGTVVRMVEPVNASAPVLAMAKGFPRYGSETEQLVRTQQVESNPVLEAMKRAWGSFKHSYYGHVEEQLRNIEILVSGLVYSAKDVENFSIAIAGFQDDVGFPVKAGFFLSALINNGKDTDYVIHTTHMAVPIDYFGNRNTKNIVVHGTIGRYLGYEMNCGSIAVDGDAHDNAGSRMKGGTITIGGNAGNDVGSHTDGLDMASGPKIFIGGNAGSNMAQGSWHVTIHVDGEIGGISIEAGSAHIYHKGILVYDG